MLGLYIYIYVCVCVCVCVCVYLQDVTDTQQIIQNAAQCKVQGLPSDVLQDHRNKYFVGSFRRRRRRLSSSSNYCNEFYDR